MEERCSETSNMGLFGSPFPQLSGLRCTAQPFGCNDLGYAAQRSRSAASLLLVPITSLVATSLPSPSLPSPDLSASIPSAFSPTERNLSHRHTPSSTPIPSAFSPSPSALIPSAFSPVPSRRAAPPCLPNLAWCHAFSSSSLLRSHHPRSDHLNPIGCEVHPDSAVGVEGRGSSAASPIRVWVLRG